MTATQARSTTEPDLARRVLTKLLEKHDPVRTRHKPLSLLRPEVRRLAENILDHESGPMSPEARAAILEDVLFEVPGIGPLEELFRDASVQEFMVAGPDRVLRRSGEGWLPTPVQFPDSDHCRRYLKKLLATSKPVGDVPTTSDGGADGILPNGFRMLAIFPPRLLEQPSLAVFRRAPQPAASTTMPATTPPPAETLPPVMQSRLLDPWERTRNRVTSRLIERLAANGVYDIQALPLTELRRVIAQYIIEFNDQEKLNLDAAAQERMTAEIVQGVQR